MKTILTGFEDFMARAALIWLDVARATKITGLLVLPWIFCASGLGQKASSPVGVDPFIAAIEMMRHSVASLDCLAMSGAEAKILERVGSAFLVSAAGAFLTAAHVISDMTKGERPCPTPAITVPANEWHPEARTEEMRWFPFKTADCRLDRALDIAVCRVSEDLSDRGRELHLKVAPVRFAWNIPPDGTPVAFTGFPLRARDPITFRGDVAAYRTPWPDRPELVLDRPALPGFSGSPIYLSDGSVVAILVKDGREEASGITIARPVSLFREMLAARPAK